MEQTEKKKKEYIIPGSKEWIDLSDQVVIEFPVGKTIPHEWLRQQFNIKSLDLKDYPDIETVRAAFNDQQFAFLQLTERLKHDILKNYNYLLVNVRGVGYAIIKPQDQTSYAYDQFLKEIKKAFSEAKEIMTHVQISQVDHEQRSKDRALFSKLGSLQQLFKDFK